MMASIVPAPRSPSGSRLSVTYGAMLAEGPRRFRLNPEIKDMYECSPFARLFGQTSTRGLATEADSPFCNRGVGSSLQGVSA